MALAKLDPRRRAFVRNYVAGPPGIRGNGTRAAIAAGYSPSTAAAQASRLLTNGKVANLVAQRFDELDANADRIISETAALAFTDARDFLEWGPDGVKLKASTELEHAAPVAGVSEHTTVLGARSLQIKFHDKVKALDLLAKVRGLYREGVGDGDRDVAEVQVVLQAPASAPESPQDQRTQVGVRVRYGRLRFAPSEGEATNGHTNGHEP